MQRALELRHVADLGGEAHVGAALLGLRADRDDIDLLAQEHVRDIAQQALPVVGVNHDVHREDLARLLPPGRIDHPLGVHGLHVGEVRAVGAVDRNALAARHEADDGIGRRRLAAAGEVGQQLVDTDDEDAFVAFRRRFRPRLGRDLGIVFLVLAGFAAHRRLQLAQADVTPRRAQVEVVALGERQARRKLVDAQAGLAHALQFAGDDGAPFGERFLQRAGRKPLPHLGPRTVRKQVAERRVEPVARRPALLGDEDFDPLPGLKRRVERNHRAVDLGAAATVAEVGVHAVGKIDRRRAARQVDDLALRRHHVDRLVERRLFVVAHPVRTVGNFVLPSQQLAQPGDLFVITSGRALAAFLVAPVRSNAQFGVLVHVAGTDLHLQRPPVAAVHGGVQRAIVVALGVGDVVVEFLGDRRPQVMHDAQHRVAILDLVDDHPQRAHVIDVGELDALAAHLVPDAVDVLRAAVDLGVVDAGGRELALQAFDGVGDELLALGALLVELLGDFLVGVGIEEAEREVLELPLQFPHPEAVGERRIEFERLARHLHAQFVRLRLGVVAQRLGARSEA